MWVLFSVAALLSVETVRTFTENALGESAVYIYDNSSELTQVTAAISALCLVAMLIDPRAVLRMYLPNGRVHLALRAANWLVSWAFLWAACGVATGARDKLRLVVAFLTLAHLLGFFGVSLIWADAAQQQQSAVFSKRKGTPEPREIHGPPAARAAAGVPVVVVAACAGAVLSLDRSPAVGAAVALGLLLVWSVYARAGATSAALRAGAAGAAGAALWLGLVSPLAAAAGAGALAAAAAGLGYVAAGGQWAGGRRAFGQRVGRDRPISASQRAARAATYPAPFPNGWYAACLSDELPPGTLRGFTALGQELVAFRGESGEVGVLSAFCVHLGADLAAGGKVKGDCVQCPFHLWEFRADGGVEAIPYTDKVPDFAKTKAYDTYEYYGNVLFWFDAEGREPAYYPPAIPELDGGGYVQRGRYSANVKMHVQEFAENSVDVAHFQPLHGKMLVPFCPNLAVPFLSVHHDTEWIQGKGSEAHISWFKNHASLLFRGKPVPHADAHATITQVGPSGVTFFKFETELGDILLFETHTPEAPMDQRVQFLWFAEKKLPRAFVWYVVGNWIAQVAQDFQVWQNKVYMPRPMVVKGDGPVARLRRWYAQFYSESSRSVGQSELIW